MSVASIYIIVGSRGIVGQQIVQRLMLLKKSVIVVTVQMILDSDSSTIIEKISKLFVQHSINPRNANVGLILAHRYRGDDNKTGLFNELCITRDFVWNLATLCSSLRVVVLGSITGQLVDIKSPEAYHYTKDLQKSIVRQSVRISNLYMNLLELSWFEKFSNKVASDDYRQIMASLKGQLGGDNLPYVNSITDFSCSLIEMPLPPRGQSIVYDGGISLFQND